MDNKRFEEIWFKPVIRVGMVTLLLAAASSFLPCVYLFIKYGVFPSIEDALKSWGMIAVVFGAFYVVEPVSYYSVLGMSGTYLSFLSGNISNLRLPCSFRSICSQKPETGSNWLRNTYGIKVYNKTSCLDAYNCLSIWNYNNI